MRTNIRRIANLVVLLAVLISPIGISSLVYAAPNDNLSPAIKPNMRIIDASYVGVSEPLGSLVPPAAPAETPSILRQMQDRLPIPKTENALSGGGLDASLVQRGPVSNSMPAPSANFEGVGNISGVLPPDTQGDVGQDPGTGKKYYIQWVNLAFQIWDVTTPAAPVSVYGPAAGNILWSGTGGICDSNNDGDPITQFDHLSNRWMMSQFALGFPDNFHQCIAVSATSDPLGAWYLYDFQTSTSLMNDYPHFGVWPDGYYMSVNQFNGSSFGWEGAGVAVFERDAMLQGLPARMIYLDIGASTLAYGGMLPSDLDGPAPAVGTPNYFMEWDDSTWLGDASDTLRIWEFDVDWAVPVNTTFGANASYDPNALISTANVDPNMCGGNRSCIDQPDTAQGLDAISDRLMYRLQYRNFGGHQTLVGNRTVDADGADHAGIYWFELRDTGAGFAMYQQGVYAGDAANTDSRWMGSIAMDEDGNIALGYSVSGAATYPSVRYTGRLATDPLNGLAQGETSLIAGSGSQTSSYARWGDYSMMAVDAADGCTFWYTQEYMQTTSSADWKTRVGSFKYPSCTAAPTGLLSGTVTDGTAPIAGAVINVSGGYTTITDASGYYELVMVDGTYDVTASKYGYVPKTANGVVVTAPATTTQDFVLDLAAVSTISGTVTDATTGWPLYARIDIFGYPLGPVFTDPVTGGYSVDLIADSYTFTIDVLSGGYDTEVQPVVVSGPAVHDFAMTADLVSCSAVGYEVSPPDFYENFETWPPAGWTIVDNIPGGGLTWNTNEAYGEPNNTGGAGLAATVSSDNVSGNYNTELQTPLIDPLALGNTRLVYKANYQKFNLDALDLDIKNAGDAGWTTILHWVEDHGVLNGLPGELVGVDLAPYITASFQLRWRYYTPETYPWDWYAQVDEVAIGSECTPLPASGLIVGTVYDANTALPLANGTVEDAAFRTARLIDNSDDPGEPYPMYVIAEPQGAVSLTASALKYGDATQTPTVVAGDTVRQDFYLAAGILSVTPDSMTFEVMNGSDDSQALILNNNGGAGAGYEVFAIPGTFAGYTPTGPFAENTRHVGPKNLNDRDASSLRVPYTMPAVPELNAGLVSEAWPTGLVYAWGIGFNTDADDLWLGNISAAGGDDLNYRFTTAGLNTGETIDTAPWVAIFAGDMTYNPFTNTLWQVNVGGDNCIYEMDIAGKVATGNKICPPFGTSERGLAFDPLTSTYYAGSWNDGIINHFAPDGSLLAAVDVGLPIAGLAFNPSTQHLFVMVNGSGYPDIYVLDTQTPNYDVLGAFYLKDLGGAKVVNGGQAALEIDCNGNLWAVNQTTQMVYKADSGESGVCDWQASWLNITPDSGVVPAYGSNYLSVTAEAAGLPAGTYEAYLRVVSETPYGDEILPVTMTVIDNSPVLTQPVNGAVLHYNRPAFNWQDFPGASSYQIQVAKAGSFASGTVVLSKTSTVSGYTPTVSLPANKLLYWRVRAKVDSVYSAWSDVWTFTTANPPSVPVLQSPLNGTLMNGPSPLFNWANSTLPATTHFDHYQIQISTNGVFTNLIHNKDISGIGNSQDNTAVLTPGRTYYWRVRSFNDVGDYSAWSKIWNVKIRYDAPTLLLPANGAMVGSLKPTFTWNLTSGAASYTIQVSRFANFSTTVVNKVVAVPTYTPATNLLPGKGYFWRVLVNGPYGPSGWSAVRSFITP